jgi:hypothetical protein
LNFNPEKATLLDKKYKIQETVPICPKTKKNYSSRNRQRTIEDESCLVKIFETQGFQLHIINEKTCQVYRKEPSAARSLAKSQESNGWILL